MYFADPQPASAPPPSGGLGKILVPAGIGLGVGGPLGAALGAGVGFILSKLGVAGPSVAAQPAAPAPVSVSNTRPQVTPDPGLSPELKAQIAYEMVNGPKMVEVRKILGDISKAKAYYTAAMGAAKAAGATASQISVALPIAVDVVLLGAAIYTMAGGDVGELLGIAHPMWDSLTPTQQAMYTSCVKNPGCNIEGLIDAGVMGAGTGSKQILVDIGGGRRDYVTIGRVGPGQYRLPDGTVVATQAEYQAGMVAHGANADTEINPVTGAPLDYQPAILSMNGYFGDLDYTVQPGDVLTQIALDHGLCKKNGSWDDCIAAANRIAAANGIPDPDLIVPGQVITLPGVEAQVVQTPAGPVVIPVAKTPFPWFMVAIAVGGTYLLWKS